jgi:rubredoxin
MAQSLVIHSHCDMCLAATGKETPADTYRIDVQVLGEPDSPKAFVVELCSEHGSPLSNAVLSLVSLGRPPDQIAREPRRAAPAAPQTLVCPTCGHRANSLQSMRAHLRTDHDSSLSDAGFLPAAFTCEHCGNTFPKAQGLAAHIRTRHPDAWKERKQSA